MLAERVRIAQNKTHILKVKQNLFNKYSRAAKKHLIRAANTKRQRINGKLRQTDRIERKKTWVCHEP